MQALPPLADAVGRRIREVPGAVVHATDPGGRLVVTLEADDSALILRNLDALQVMEGVLSAVLVSEHTEPLAAADQELPDDAPPPHAA